MTFSGINRNGNVQNEHITEATSLLATITSSSSSLSSLHALCQRHRRNDDQNVVEDRTKNSPQWWKIIIVFIIGLLAIVCPTFVLLRRIRTLPTTGTTDDEPPSSTRPVRNEYNYNENTKSITITSSSNVRHDIVEHYQPEKIHATMPTPIMYLSETKQQQQQKQSNHDEIENSPLSSLRWGILGLGRIAHDFTSTLIVLGCNVTAVASATPSLPITALVSTNTTTSSPSTSTSALVRAKTFATHFSIPTYYDSYKKMASDPNVDIVYIATTNQNHMNPTLMMLRSGKNVLVEKPTAITYQDAKLMYDEAEKRGLFLMTNHWTRFFPLVKYLRQTFLLASTLSVSNNSSSTLSERAGQPLSNQTLASTTHETTNPANKTQQLSFNLGQVLAMHGDFGFITPVDPTDRFLNRTLGGGVTLDVGCYLVELALLAAYDHGQSQKSLRRMQKISSSDDRKRLLMKYLTPEDIVATGHGVYHGVSYPVDVESSFSLRWGGGPDGIDVCDVESEHDDMKGKTGKRQRRLGKTSACDESTSQKRITQSLDEEFTMVATFEASFRRPSTFEVEYAFERGRILIHGPGNCPSEMTVYEYEQPYGPVFRETKINFPLPSISSAILRYGQSNYPRAEGFAYVIDEIEKCMAERGVPGRRDGRRMSRRCLELNENTVEEQLVTVEVTEKVLAKLGYFGR